MTERLATERACAIALARAARDAGTRQQVRAAARAFVRRHRRDDAYLRWVLRSGCRSAALAVALLGFGAAPAFAALPPFAALTGSANPMAGQDVGVFSRLAFADLDRDGDLDLIVTSYVSATEKHNPFCGNARLKTRAYCHPLRFDPLPSVVYRNDGKGTFTDVSAESGVSALRGNGLGVVIADYDDDSWPEVFVANDSMPNFMFRRSGPWRYEDIALRAGVAVASDGKERAGMGTDAADYDGDGLLDLVVTNLDFESFSLFRGLGNRLFAYATPESGIGAATLPFVGFGTVFLDFDNDGLTDLAFANGHMLDNASQFRAGATHAQRNLLFRNMGMRRFADVTAASGPGFAIEKVSRGLAAGDIDNDGDLDLLVTNNGQSVDLLRNDGSPGHALLVRLIGTQSNRDGIGARLRLTADARTQVREVKAGSSYLGQNDLRQHFGLGPATRVDRLEVRWPSGRLDVVRDIPADQILTIREGAGVVGNQALRR